MTTDILVPDDLWQDAEPAVITNWLARDGSQIQQGALIAEIMSGKVQSEIRAPAAGRLTILLGVDAIVSKGTVIGRVG